jgi:hypothetical protein
MDYVFEYHWAANAVEFNRLTAKAPLPDNGSLILRSKGEEIRVPVRLGREQEVTLGDRSLRLHFFRIRSALADSKDVNLDNRLQRSEAPILYLRVDGRDIRVPRDDKEFMSDFAILPGVDLRFDWPDPSDHGVSDIYRVVGGRDEGLFLVQTGDGDRPVVQRLGREPVALLGGLSKFWFGIEQSVRSAKRGREVLEVSDEEFLSEGGTARDRLLAAEAEIEIDGRWGKVHKKITPYDPPIQYGDAGHGRPFYRFRIFKTETARDWYSVLTAIDYEGRVLKSHNVQVNSPLRYGGYRFFQARAGTTPEGLGMSGISVTANPGVNFMYLGYAVLTLGVSYIFFARPVIARRQRRRRREAA